MKKFLQKLWILFFDNSLPKLTKMEERLICEIKNKMVLLDDFYNSANVLWNDNLISFRDNVLHKDIRSFIRWKVIYRTMFVANAKYIKKELGYLKKNKEWGSRWSKAIVESKVGRPIPSIYHMKSSGNLIHHCYHVYQFENETNTRVENLEFVLEFGGGYGSMCRLFRKLGFRGHYLIFDFPHFSALQEYYLNANLISTGNLSDLKNDKKITACFSKMEFLEEKILPYLSNRSINSMFLATWSLSESPLEVRNAMNVLLPHFKNMLVAYQDHFEGIDNKAYFDLFKKKCVNMNWKVIDIDHIPGNNYLMGRSNIKL